MADAQAADAGGSHAPARQEPCPSACLCLAHQLRRAHKAFLSPQAWGRRTNTPLFPLAAAGLNRPPAAFCPRHSVIKALARPARTPSRRAREQGLWKLCRTGGTRLRQMACSAATAVLPSTQVDVAAAAAAVTCLCSTPAQAASSCPPCSGSCDGLSAAANVRSQGLHATGALPRACRPALHCSRGLHKARA